jgi:hypothetical protein
VIDYIMNKGTVSPAVEGRLSFVNDVDPPVITVLTPQPDVAVQDGTTFQATVTDQSAVSEVLFYIRQADGGEGTPVGYEGVAASLNGGIWQYALNTTLLPDGNYVFFVKATDEVGNEGWSDVIPFSIRNWAVMEMLPSTPNSKAGRTMPVKFTLRVVPTVDPAEPFVFNTQLAIKIYQCNNTSCSSKSLKQVSHYGMGTTDYRIDLANEVYQTNFKTAKSPAQYLVQIWRATQNFMIGSFSFKTVK